MEGGKPPCKGSGGPEMTQSSMTDEPVRQFEKPDAPGPLSQKALAVVTMAGLTGRRQ